MKKDTSDCKEVLLVLTDDWADWEAANAIAEINSSNRYSVKTISFDKREKTSIGGLRTAVDYDIIDYQYFSKLAMVILLGGFAWGRNEKELSGIPCFLRKVMACGVPIAAICGATLFRANHGFLDTIKHTGDSLKYFSESTTEGYCGSSFFCMQQVVVDQGIVTANETAAIEFAYEIFKLLDLDTPTDIEEWYAYYRKGIY